MENKDFQKKQLERIYRDASLAPVFKSNPKYCLGDCKDLIPYISYDDVMQHKYIIRGRAGDESFNPFYSEKKQIITEYNSVEEMVNDGWELD